MDLSHAEIFAKSQREGYDPSDYFPGSVVYSEIFFHKAGVLYFKGMQYCFKSSDSPEIEKIAKIYTRKFKQARLEGYAGAGQDLLESIIKVFDPISVVPKGPFKRGQNMFALSLACISLGISY